MSAATLCPGTLLILDGWGHAPAGPGNAIAAARTPELDRLSSHCPAIRLRASGEAVGLPAGVVGNSEVGHLVIGAGRAIEYDSLRVQRQAESGELRANAQLTATCGRLASSGGALHLVMLCSDGRIHSDIAHLRELLRAAHAAGLADVRIHAITDGRDVADGTAAHYVAQLGKLTQEAGTGRCATLIGRNFAMDKSGDLELTERAANLILNGTAEHTALDPAAALAASPATSDGWLPPTVVREPADRPPVVRDGDALLFANFRSDRTAPLADLIVEKLRATDRAAVQVLTLAEYDTESPLPALVPRPDASGGLADALEQAGVRSVRIAEQEKFAHVTFFVNGRDARPRPLEEHVPVPTRSGSRYTELPEMNVADVAWKVATAGTRSGIGLVVANLANIDVVGHTGDYQATVSATEAVDRAVAVICSAARESGRWVLLVGDHGNGEQMLQPAPDGTVRGYGGHTSNLVPFILAEKGQAHQAVRTMTAPARTNGGYSLPSVGPAVLTLLGVPVPPAMSAPVPVFSGRD